MKISVIGAGPAGSITALKGFEHHDITIYEEHETQPVQCAGLVSKSGLERIGIPLKKSLIKNQVRGAVIVSPSGTSFSINGKETRAYVIDRREFDHYLLNTAVDCDVNFVNKKVENLGDMDADRIVLATGTDYSLHRKFNLDMPERFLIGAQYDMRVECDKDFVELHFNTPDFFSWIIPVGDHARVGSCSSRNPVRYLENFLEKLGKDGRIKSTKILNRNFGIIPIYNPNVRTDYGKIITVGDAAGHVKASTGGGIVMGGIAAGFACQPDYERRWKSEIGKELQLHLMINRFLGGLSGKKMDRLFSLIKEHKWILEEKGDMDMASKVLSGLFKNPVFTLKFLRQLPGYAFDVF
jgi:digeranylgeranylglycerophospholipid reductase